jgi:acetyl esterase/lipase
MAKWDDILQKLPVYSLPGMDDARVERDLPYRTVGGEAYLADIYRPPGADTAPLPAIIFVHGDGPPEFGLPKAWGQYRGWGRLAAASGLVGVTFNRRPPARLTALAEAASDVDTLLAWVQAEGATRGIDITRLCLWCCSAGVPYGMRAALSDAPGIRCVVAYYGMLDLRQLRADVAPQITDETLRAYSALASLEETNGHLPPTLIVKAARDTPAINDSIDRFVATAQSLNAPIESHTHETGQHAFDILDDDDRSRALIHCTLDFIREHLAS